MSIHRKICLLVLGLVGAAVLPAAPAEFDWQSQVQSAADGQWQITVQCNVAENCYLDSGMTYVNVLLDDDSTMELAPQRAPEAGKYTAGKHHWRGTAKHKPVQTQINFQGCRGEECLMPQQILIALSGEKPAVKSAAGDDAPQLPDSLSAALESYSQVRTVSGLLTEAELVGFLQGQGTDNVEAGTRAPDMSFWAILLLVVLGGLGLNLTPCVLPMIPINLAIIGAGTGSTSRWQGFRRGTAYALGITLAYGVLGLLAAFGGRSFGSLNSSSIFNWVIAAVFLLLALGMFGVYELDFSRFSTIFQRKGGKKFQLPPEISAFGMGVVAALLAGACVAPVVITVILLAARLYSQGHSWGVLLPFALGLSMALPWPLLGAGLSVLPKPGAWMVRVKQLFGALILGMALYYGYLGWTLYGGSVDQQKATDSFTAEVVQAAANDESVLIDCWATWCKNCTVLEARLEAPEVQAVLKERRIRIIKFQAEKSSDPEVKAFMQRYDLRGLPSLVLLEKGSQL